MKLKKIEIWKQQHQFWGSRHQKYTNFAMKSKNMGNFGLKMHWQKKIWVRAHFQNGRQIVVFLPFWRYKYLCHYSRMGWYSKIPIIIMDPHDMYYHSMTLPKNGPQKNGTAHAHHLLERMLIHDFWDQEFPVNWESANCEYESRNS